MVILSVTEGEDKPIKYPDMFHRAALVIFNKIDLLPHLDFDMEACMGYLRQVNPDVAVLPLSVKSGQGLSAWYDWLRAQRREAIISRIQVLEDNLQTLRQQNAGEHRSSEA